MRLSIALPMKLPMKSSRSLSLKKLFAAAGLALAAVGACAETPQRIVSAGHAVTELALALGVGDNLVAVDSSTRLPEDFRRLPVVGYYRQLPPEGLLAQRPELLIGGEHMGPASTLELLHSSGVAVVKLPEARNGEELLGNIEHLAGVLEKPAGEVAAGARADLAALKKSVASLPEKPRVLFVRAQSGRGIKVAGADTSPHSLIRLSGGQNAVDFSGYKTLTDEALLKLRPDWIFYSSDQAQQLKEGAALLEWLPLLKLTPAGERKAFAEVDGYALLGGIGLASLQEAKRINRLFSGETTPAAASR